MLVECKITRQTLRSILTKGNTVRVTQGIPKNAKLSDYKTDPITKELVLIFETTTEWDGSVVVSKVIPQSPESP